MPSLREVQRMLAAVFTHPRGVRPGLRAAGFDARRRPVTNIVADRPPVPLHTRLAVYSDGYFFRLLEVLGQDHAAVRRALGEEDFRRLAADYLLRHPSRSPFINETGGALPGFLRSHPFGRRFPYLSELAALERLALESLFADRLPRADLSGAGPSARFRTDTSVRLLKTRWEVDRLWEDRGLPSGRGLRRLSSPASRRLLIFRDDAWVRVRPVEEAEFTILGRMGKGTRLAAALRGLENKTAAPAVRRCFERWTRDGVLKRVG